MGDRDFIIQPSQDEVIEVQAPPHRSAHRTGDDSGKRRRGTTPATNTGGGPKKDGSQGETKAAMVPARPWSLFARLSGPKSWTDGKIKNGLKLATFKKRLVYFEYGSHADSLIDERETVEMWVMECKSGTCDLIVTVKVLLLI